MIVCTNPAQSPIDEHQSEITISKRQDSVSSVEMRVLCHGGGRGVGLAHAQSDVTSTRLGHIGTQKKIYHLWLDKNSRWQMENSHLIGQ